DPRTPVHRGQGCLDARPLGELFLDDGVAYLRPGPFYNVEVPEELENPADFITFVDSAFEMFLSARARALIVDLRNNPGGDSSFSDPLVAWFAHRPFCFASSFRIRSSEAAEASNRARLERTGGGGISETYAKRFAATPHGEVFELELPNTKPRTRRFPGPVFVLIDRASYSNAVSTAALVQDYGFATVAGEATADLATTYGAMEHFALPVTGLRVGFPKAHIIRPNGDPRPAGVVPDLPLSGPPDQVLEALRHKAIEAVE
ncbi:MAG: S41 family peptidase, partial [Myxococcota bacterium]